MARFTVVALCLLCFWLPGCGDDAPFGEYYVIPSVKGTVPLDGAEDVAPNAHVVVTFSEVMMASTINDTTVTLAGEDGLVAAAVSLDPDGKVATLIPSLPMLGGRTYTAMVYTGARSEEGQIPLEVDHAWSFGTAIWPLTIVATTPLNQDHDAPANTPISVTFATAMAPSILESGDIQLFPLLEPGSPLPASLSLDAQRLRVSITPDAPLLFGVPYIVVVALGTSDASGRQLVGDQPYTWQFELAPRPLVSATAPGDAATNVGVEQSVTVSFDKAMDPATISVATLTLRRGDSTVPVAGSVSYDPNERVATFDPDAPLWPSAIYRATISHQAADTGGAQLAADLTWTFTTVAPVAPTVVAFRPFDAAPYVSINDRVRVAFSLPMDAATLTAAGTFTLRQGSTLVPGSVSVDDIGVVTFTPALALAPGALYTATLTTAATSLAHAALAADYSWSFTTTACSLLAVNLGAAAPFALLGGPIENAGATAITGDVGFANFAPGNLPAGQVTGALVLTGTVETPLSPPSPVPVDFLAAYADVGARVLCVVDVTGDDLGGATYTPGLYKADGSMSNSGIITLDAQGDPEAVFIFQIGDTLTTSTGHSVALTNGALAANVFWWVNFEANIGAQSALVGTLLTNTIRLGEGASLQGRALTRNGLVVMSNNVIEVPAL